MEGTVSVGGRKFSLIGEIKVPKPAPKKDDSASVKNKKKPGPLTPRKPLPKIPQEKKCIDYETKKEYNVGDEWFGEDDCMHCTCIRDGYPVCSTPMCALPFCTTGEAFKVKGRCCPVCPEDLICRSKNGRARIAYKERWQEDDCQVCECTKGGVSCVDPSKVSQKCKSPQRWNGKCKPVCLDDVSKSAFSLVFLLLLVTVPLLRFIAACNSTGLFASPALCRR